MGREKAGGEGDRCVQGMVNEVSHSVTLRQPSPGSGRLVFGTS